MVISNDSKGVGVTSLLKIKALATAMSAAALTAAAPAQTPAQTAPSIPASTPQAASAAIPLATASAVSSYYQVRPTVRMWFKPTAAGAPIELVNILKRAQLDGLASGPMLAFEAEQAIDRARGGDPAAVEQAEKILSAAWVLYVEALNRPAAGVEYGDPHLAPKGTTAERILLQAEHAPLLQQHLKSVSGVNAIYAGLRDAAWAQVQSGGIAALDSRLAANLDRARILPAKGRFILADIATARLWMYEDGRIVDTMKVIVGRRDSPTPMIASTISYATFNPYWNVPVDVVKRVHAPKIVKAGAAKYLKSNKFEVASDWTDQATVVAPADVDWKAVASGSTEVRIRQLPGGTNMMGHYKFSFPNSTGIYLHDTPYKEKFKQNRRTESLGCVRVEDAKRLAAWLLQAEPVAPNEQPEQHVQLPQGVPIYLTYLTAHTDETGQLTFADDIYGWDKPATQMAVAP